MPRRGRNSLNNRRTGNRGYNPIEQGIDRGDVVVWIIAAFVTAIVVFWTRFFGLL